MVTRRRVFATGMGLALAGAGCTPQARWSPSPIVTSATPARRTSADPDTDRILAEIGPDVLQLTVYPDRVYVTTVGRRNLVSSGGPFATAPEAPIPALAGLPHGGVPFPADAFLIGTVRRLVRGNEGDFGAVDRPEDQVVLDILRGQFPQQRTIRCAVAPDREIPALDYRTEQGVESGLLELRAVPRTVPQVIGLSRHSEQQVVLSLQGRMEEQDVYWYRDQFRPLGHTRGGVEPHDEVLDPGVVGARALLQVCDDLLRRSEVRGSVAVWALSRNGSPVLEFSAGTDNDRVVSGTADLSGRILQIR